MPMLRKNSDALKGGGALTYAQRLSIIVALDSYLILVAVFLVFNLSKRRL